MNICRKCGDPLIAGENVTQYRVDNYNYICRGCERKYHRKQERERLHRTGQFQPMSENKACTMFLGIHVAERVLSQVFKDVERMPITNPGFDFICNKGMKIDVKSSCRCHSENRSDSWLFHIKKNLIADFFICLAFDSRKSLNPEHIWMIPGGTINNLLNKRIYITNIEKWNEYKLDINKVVKYCDEVRFKTKEATPEEVL